jgi:hypothetical protein
MLDLGVPIEQVNYLAGHKSIANCLVISRASKNQSRAFAERRTSASKQGEHSPDLPCARHCSLLA